MKKSTAKFASARAAGEAFLGVEVSWDMGDNATDIKIPRDKFEALFTAAGANPNIFKPEQTPENNLARACRIGWSYQLGIDSRTISVKQLSRPDKDTPLAFGVYYRISVEGERDRWELGARVRVESATGLVVVQPPQDTTDFPSEGAKKWAQAIADYSNAVVDTAFNSHVSDALIAFGHQLGWVGRRVAGGVYFIPGEAGERFLQVLDGLEALTQDNRVRFEGNATPQYADPRTLQTWQRRTTATFTGEIEALTAKLKDMTSRDNVRESSFDLRVAECSELMARAEQYSAILQDQLGPLKTALETLKGQFGDAQAKLRQAKGKADAAFASIQQMAAKETAKAAKKAPKKATVKVQEHYRGPAGGTPAKVPAHTRTVRHTKETLDRLFAV